MELRRRLPIALLAAAALSTGQPVPAGAAPAAGHPVRSDAAAQPVTLITGDRVAIRTDSHGRQTVVTRAAEGRGSFSTIRENGELYVIPHAALPYVGTSLDLNLFDVSALIRDGNTARVPVRVSGTAAVPGLTVTGTPNAITTDGYVAAVDARAFGAALTAQAKHDIATGVPSDRQLFGGVSAVRYAGRGAAPVVHPNFPMFTLRIDAIGLDGGPLDSGVVPVMNVDDGRKFLGNAFVVDGEARVSVPAGHYAALLASSSLDAAGTFTPRVVTREFEVTGAGEITMDARAATGKIEFALPKPAVEDEIGLAWQRVDAMGGTLTFMTGSPGDVFVAPAPAVTVGAQHYVSSGTFVSAPGVTPAYGFDLHGASTGDIPAVQRTVVALSALATVREVFATDKVQNGIAARATWEPWQPFTNANAPSVPFPLRNTEYVSAAPGQTHSVLSQASDSFDAFGGLMDNGQGVLSPGQQLDQEWWRAPIRPGFPVIPLPPGLDDGCPACRVGDTISVFITPEADSTPSHRGFLDFPSDGVTSTSRFQLLADGVSLADLPDQNGGDIDVPAGPKTYRMIYDQTRVAPWFVTAPVSHTEWTFRSDTSTTRTVPGDLICVTGENCTALSLPDPTYDLDSSLLNTMKPGAAAMNLTIRRTAGAAHPARLTNVAVSLSFNGGRTFVPAVVVPRGHDQFSVVWVNPRQDGPVTLKLHAGDAAGTAVDQTIQGAYVISGGSRG